MAAVAAGSSVLASPCSVLARLGRALVLAGRRVIGALLSPLPPRDWGRGSGRASLVQLQACLYLLAVVPRRAACSFSCILRWVLPCC
jgi:hypothetical protein